MKIQFEFPSLHDQAVEDKVTYRPFDNNSLFHRVRVSRSVERGRNVLPFYESTFPAGCPGKLTCGGVLLDSDVATRHLDEPCVADAATQEPSFRRLLSKIAGLTFDEEAAGEPGNRNEGVNGDESNKPRGRTVVQRLRHVVRRSPLGSED